MLPKLQRKDSKFPVAKFHRKNGGALLGVGIHHILSELGIASSFAFHYVQDYKSHFLVRDIYEKLLSSDLLKRTAFFM